jgi:hypothetical protein
MTDETTRPGMSPGESRRDYKARLRAMGFEPEPPPTEEIGYGGTDFGDPLDWLDDHDPACVLRCESTDQVVGRVWVTRDGMVWVRGTRGQDCLDGTSSAGRPTFSSIAQLTTLSLRQPDGWKTRQDQHGQLPSCSAWTRTRSTERDEHSKSDPQS